MSLVPSRRARTLVVRATAATALMCALGAVAASPVTADEPAPVDVIAELAPEVLEHAAPATAVATTPDGQSVDVNDIAVTLPEDPSGPVRIDSDTLDVQLGLPFAEQAGDAELGEGAIPQYDNANGSSTVPVVKDDGSVQFTTVIDDAAAPTAYTYDLSLPPGASLTLREGGGVSIDDVDGAFLGGLTPPWAVDAAGRAVPTRYVVQGSRVTQLVDHTAGGTVYPVVADPWLGKDLMNTPYLTFPSRGYVVNVNPTRWGRQNFEVWTHLAHLSELRTKMGSRAYRITYSVEQQFLCHVAGNQFEPGTYNLESWRRAMAWGLQLNPAIRCNP